MDAVSLRLYQYLSVGLFKTCLSIPQCTCLFVYNISICIQVYSDLVFTRSNNNELETGSRIDEVDFCDNILPTSVQTRHQKTKFYSITQTVLRSTHCSKTGKVRHVDHQRRH